MQRIAFDVGDQVAKRGQSKRVCSTSVKSAAVVRLYDG